MHIVLTVILLDEELLCQSKKEEKWGSLTFYWEDGGSRSCASVVPWGTCTKTRGIMVVTCQVNSCHAFLKLLWLKALQSLTKEPGFIKMVIRKSKVFCWRMCKSAEEILSRNRLLKIFDCDTTDLHKWKSIFTCSQECQICQQNLMTLTSGFGSCQDCVRGLKRNHCWK